MKDQRHSDHTSVVYNRPFSAKQGNRLATSQGCPVIDQPLATSPLQKHFTTPNLDTVLLFLLRLNVTNIKDDADSIRAFLGLYWDGLALNR